MWDPLGANENNSYCLDEAKKSFTILITLCSTTFFSFFNFLLIYYGTFFTAVANSLFRSFEGMSSLSNTAEISQLVPSLLLYGMLYPEKLLLIIKHSTFNAAYSGES